MLRCKKQYTLVLTSNKKDTFLQIKKNLDSHFLNAYTLVPLPRKRKRLVVLRSPHVNSKSKEHFETLFYRRLLKIDLTFLELKKLINLIPSYVLIKLTMAGNSAAW